MCDKQKQPLPEDMIHPVTHNTTNAAPLPDYEAQGLGRYDVAPDNEIPDLAENQTAGLEQGAAPEAEAPARAQRPLRDPTLEE